MPDTPTPTPTPAPAKILKVEPAEAAIGSFGAGLVSYITTYITNKYHIPSDWVAGGLGLFFSGAMAVWHHFA